MMDYAKCYKTWIKDKHKSLEVKELRYQTKIYDDIKKHVKKAHAQAVEAEHQLKIVQLQVSMQASLMRRI